jgi:methyltransferase-like protein
MAENDYDKVPYESYPYPNTHPENLFTIGKLFGLKAVAPKKCRVLELGCASGGNIIPMAIKFPNSEFVGVDLSKVQIDEGNKHIEKLNLNNLSLQNISIMDINKDFGKFDYIVVHGILSWVSKQVQDKIFEVCNDNLNTNGIAYISYNTLPGWNMIKSIREMMLYHTSRFTDPVQKTKEARLLLEFIKDGNGDKNSAYAEVIQNEINTLKNVGDSYLIHDHMEEINDPYYFHDFMEKAGKTSLQYLGDTTISTMFAGNFPKETIDVLMQVNHDAVRVEQYMDFVTNRRFRSTLLCHKSVNLNKNLTGESIKDFYISSLVKPEKDPKDIDLTQNETVTFSNESGFTFSTNNHAVITALLYMAESNDSIAVKSILAEVKKRLGSANAEAVEKAVLENLLRLVLAGMPISSFPADYVNKVSDKPKISDLSRYQATYSLWVTNQKSSKINIDLFGRVLCQYLDGENDFDAIVEKMVKHVVNNDINLNANGEKITAKDKIEEGVRLLTKQLIDNFVPNALLVA